MAKHFVTFGQIHTHRINGITLDCDCVAEYEASNYEEGREKAFELFGTKFFTDYHGKFPIEDLQYFPRGIIKIDNNNDNRTNSNYN